MNLSTTSKMVSSIALSIVKDLDSSEEWAANKSYLGAWQQLASLQNSASYFAWPAP